ncbi:hypothetical protein PAMP_004082 [Pampus punctatissimus]
MFVLACVSQTEEDLKKERKKQRAENEGVGKGRPEHHRDITSPLWFLAWHIDTNNNAPGGCHFFLCTPPLNRRGVRDPEPPLYDRRAERKAAVEALQAGFILHLGCVSCQSDLTQSSPLFSARLRRNTHAHKHKRTHTTVGQPRAKHPEATSSRAELEGDHTQQWELMAFLITDITTKPKGRHGVNRVEKNSERRRRRRTGREAKRVRIQGKD